MVKKMEYTVEVINHAVEEALSDYSGAYEKGHNEGYNSGYEVGWDIGHLDGYEEGYTNGQEDATPALQEKSVTPSASDQTITADNNYDGLSQVIINGDTDLIPANIAKDVDIFGVVGEFTGSSDIVREVITLRNTYSATYMSDLVTESHVMSQITKPVFMYFTLSFSYAEYALHWYLFSTDGGVTWFNFMNGASQAMPVTYSGDNSGGKSYAKYLVLNVNGPEIDFRCHQLRSSTFQPIDLTLTVVGQP